MRWLFYVLEIFAVHYRVIHSLDYCVFMVHCWTKYNLYPNVCSIKACSRINASGPSLVQLWLVTSSAPNHYMNQCWIIPNKTLGNQPLWSVKHEINCNEFPSRQHLLLFVQWSDDGHFLWPQRMMISSNWGIFHLLAICAGDPLVTGEFPSQRPMTQSFDVFFDLHLDKRLSKQSWGRWFETPSHSLWRHRNGCISHVLCYWILQTPEMHDDTIDLLVIRSSYFI